MRKLLPLKSSHGHVEEIEERQKSKTKKKFKKNQKKLLCKAKEKPEVLQEEKKGSYHSRWRKHQKQSSIQVCS